MRATPHTARGGEEDGRDPPRLGSRRRAQTGQGQGRGVRVKVGVVGGAQADPLLRLRVVDIMGKWTALGVLSIVLAIAGCSQGAKGGTGTPNGTQGTGGQLGTAGNPIGTGGTPAPPPTNNGVVPANPGTRSGSGGTSGGMPPAASVNGGAGTGMVGGAGTGMVGGAAMPALAGGGGAAGSGAAGAPAPAAGPGGFPKAEPVDTNQMGPHAFDSYTMGIDDPAYDSAVMYYPTDADPPFGAVVFSPGFTATKEQYETFLGPLLASHGIAIMLTTPTTTADLPDQRAVDLQAGIAVVQKENTRDGSPLKGKLATDRICITGHSMGGGGTMIAANTLGNMIRCAVPLQPWEPGLVFPMVSAPIMFIAAQADTVAAVAQNALPFYQSVPDTVPKYYVEFSGASHFLTTNDLGTSYDGQSKYMIAFYKVYLEDDMRYLDVLNAPMDAELSMYLKSM